MQGSDDVFQLEKMEGRRNCHDQVKNYINLM